MPYFIALKKEDHYTIVPEHFGVRSNAQKYAERMGWKDFWIATEEQKAIIEAGTYGEASANSYVEVVKNVEVISPPEPDAKWMKEEGIPWNKKPRKPKKK